MLCNPLDKNNRHILLVTSDLPGSHDWTGHDGFYWTDPGFLDDKAISTTYCAIYYYNP